jgi:hypothetical protein
MDQGLLARSIVLDGESEDRFKLLITSLRDELQPETPIENLLIDKLEPVHCCLMRAWELERAGIAHLGKTAAPVAIQDAIQGAPTRDALAFGGQNHVPYERNERAATVGLPAFRTNKRNLCHPNPVSTSKQTPGVHL